ncbi:unnamed protein product [Colias eurytheme]|nr:unnamed protein product [Colias eurytheme]
MWSVLRIHQGVAEARGADSEEDVSLYRPSALAPHDSHALAHTHPAVPAKRSRTFENSVLHSAVYER